MQEPLEGKWYFFNYNSFHQGSALSLYMFALVINDITRHIQDEVPSCMLLADYIVLLEETKGGINYIWEFGGWCISIFDNLIGDWSFVWVPFYFCLLVRLEKIVSSLVTLLKLHVVIWGLFSSLMRMTSLFDF